jgi:hypothetical protein
MIPTSGGSLWYNILADMERGRHLPICGGRPASSAIIREEKMKGKEKLGDIRRALIDYFANYNGTDGAPSFAKFRRGHGLSYADFERLKKKRGFSDVLKECSEFRRDYLIDCGLTKRFDASFVKFVLQIEGESGDVEIGTPIISFEVVDE